MPILKCKMCGGNLNVIDNDTVCTCEYCGTTQTIPLIDSDKKARLFNRANDYRLNNDFSRAYNAYEAIVSENPNEAEAYWGMILSEYGVEYVDDPKTGKKIPTCHRTSLKSIKTNNNYLKAIEYADIEGKMIYEDEADQLDKLQKDILSVSSKEKPYDVFICYKESDDNGERTHDSVIAQELYDELTNRGMNVFFARISLEDKFGQNYEPYIYNALRSAKVMLLVTTSSEHCNATWVKNEWSRYLEFIKDDFMKSLIPVIKDMSPYELPEELQRLQVLDLNKIGSRQDLIRGVLKICGKGKDHIANANNFKNKSHNVRGGSLESQKEDTKESNSLKKKKVKKSMYIVIFALLIICILAFSIYEMISYFVVKNNNQDIIINNPKPIETSKNVRVSLFSEDSYMVFTSDNDEIDFGFIVAELKFTGSETISFDLGNLVTSEKIYLNDVSKYLKTLNEKGYRVEKLDIVDSVVSQEKEYICKIFIPFKTNSDFLRVLNSTDGSIIEFDLNKHISDISALNFDT